MRKIVKMSLVTAITLASTLYASSANDKDLSVRKEIESITTEQTPKNLSVVDSANNMFQDAKISGDIRSIYSSFHNNNDTDTYATAIGMQLKYELAKYKGFNAGVAFTTANDINFLSGNRNEGKRNEALSGAKGSYTELTQAYINYEFQGLNLRVGRQLIDTPLADSDDIRMIPNTFEAYIATYDIDGFSFMIGHLNRWQGSDAGLDNHWVKTGKNGTNFAGVTYSNNFVETNLWYYNITGAENGNNALYADATLKHTFHDDLKLNISVQYLNENEVDKSGIKANIYGAMVEVETHGFDFTLAYNKSSKESSKTTFSGFGGGTLFTSMDTMILDEITTDRNARAIVAGISYTLNDFTLSYAYGDFKGDADSTGTKAHIVEQDIGFEYSYNENLSISANYIIDDNKEDATSTDFNDKNFRVLVSYKF